MNDILAPATRPAELAAQAAEAAALPETQYLLGLLQLYQGEAVEMVDSRARAAATLDVASGRNAAGATSTAVSTACSCTAGSACCGSATACAFPLCFCLPRLATLRPRPAH